MLSTPKEILAHEIVDPARAEQVNRSFSANALKMMKKRYLQMLPTGEQETPVQMLHRVAHSLADVELEYGASTEQRDQTEKEFFEVLASHEYTPAGRTLTNAGAPTPVVANCIVLPIHDSMDSIFKTLKDAALLQKAGSGLGFAFSHLRPAGSNVLTSQGMASGPVSFLHVYNEAFGVIKQQGRHGANMAVLNIEHPDILDFIHCKRVEGMIRNFNISVGITDRFMKQVLERPNDFWMGDFKGERMKPRRISRDKSGVILEIKDEDITAVQLFDEIVHSAWFNGEPGVVFLDTVNRDNPMIKLQEIDACNPCGEQFLPWYDVCNLSSINLAKFVKDGGVDYERLRYVTRVAIRLSDNVINLSNYPVREVSEMTRANRRIGLGIMGFADMLYQLGIRYDSENGYALAEKVMQTINEEAHQVSRELAETRGVFPNWTKSSYYEKGIRMRNTMLTTVAPTGSISMFFETSSGIEPNFALAFTKQDKDGMKYIYVNKYLEKALCDRGLYTNELMDKIIQEGSLVEIKDLPQDIKDTFVVAMDISAEAHIRMQAAFQKHVDNAISKTINFPFTATEDEVRQGYVMAWKMGCKGCTVYRDGSRQVQILNLNKNIKDKQEVPLTTQALGLDKSEKQPTAKLADVGQAEMQPITEFKPPVTTDAAGYGIVEPRPRPPMLEGRTYQIQTPYGKLYVTINDIPSDGPFEVFAQLGKAGGFFHSQVEAICRLISLNLRAGVRVEKVIKQIKGIRGPDPMWSNGKPMFSIADAIGQIMEQHMKDKAQKKAAAAGIKELPFEKKMLEESKQPTLVNMVSETQPVMAMATPVQDDNEISLADFGSNPFCPDCGTKLMVIEGCNKCPSCGYSKCG